MSEEFLVDFEQDTETQVEDTVADIPSLLDARMNELPDNQKEFFLDHLTPETLAMIGLILGDPALDFFQPMTDMNKTISISEREKASVDSDEESLATEAVQEVKPLEEPVEEVNPEPEEFSEDIFTI